MGKSLNFVSITVAAYFKFISSAIVINNQESFSTAN